MPSAAQQKAAEISATYPDSQAPSEIFGYSDFHVETHAPWWRSVVGLPYGKRNIVVPLFPSRRR